MIMDNLSISQVELSRRSGIAYATINKIINRKYQLSYKLMSRIAEALNVQLLEIDDEQQQEFANTFIQGYLEYDDDIYKISSFAQLKRIVERIEYETKILPREVREIKRLNKLNSDRIKNHVPPTNIMILI